MFAISQMFLSISPSSRIRMRKVLSPWVVVQTFTSEYDRLSLSGSASLHNGLFKLWAWTPTRSRSMNLTQLRALDEDSQAPRHNPAYSSGCVLWLSTRWQVCVMGYCTLPHGIIGCPSESRNYYSNIPGQCIDLAESLLLFFQSALLIIVPCGISPYFWTELDKISRQVF